MLRALWHMVEHRMGWSSGHVISWWAGNGDLMVGLACTDCARISHAGKTVIDFPDTVYPWGAFPAEVRRPPCSSCK
jgi:hypothetical protein